MRRTFPKDRKKPVAFGWVFVTPKRPPTECSWCSDTLVNLNGLRLCPTCDEAAIITIAS